MKKLKKMAIHILCEIGKNGVGKSISWGIYEIKIPNELRNMNESNKVNNVRERV